MPKRLTGRGFEVHTVENRISVHDLHATMLHLLVMDHERGTDRDFRLTDVHGTVVRDIIAGDRPATGSEPVSFVGKGLQSVSRFAANTR